MSKPSSDKRSNPSAAGKNDADSLFDQALSASLAQRHDEAVAQLERILQLAPGHARARHLLGAEYAQAGKISEALIELSVALELNPAMVMARFQLGLLLLTSGKPQQAAAVWAPLESLGKEHVLNLFKDGMLQMAHDDFTAARATLLQAMAENIDLPILNEEIATALRAMEQPEARQEAAATSNEEPAQQEQAASQDDSHILVSTYGGNSTTH